MSLANKNQGINQGKFPEIFFFNTFVALSPYIENSISYSFHIPTMTVIRKAAKKECLIRRFTISKSYFESS